MIFRNFICSVVFVFFGAVSTFAAGFDPQSFVAQMKSVPEGVTVLPGGSKADPASAASVRELIHFSLLRVLPLIDEMEAQTGFAHTPSQLRSDAVRIKKALEALMKSAEDGILFLVPVKFTQNLLQARVYMMSFPIVKGVTSNFVIFDSDLLDLYHQDPEFWSAEILRGLLSGEMPEGRSSYRMRAALWAQAGNPFSNSRIERARLEYEQVPDDSFTASYMRSIKIVPNSSSDTVIEELGLVFLEEPPVALSQLRHRVLKAFEENFSTFRRRVAAGQDPEVAYENLAKIYIWTEMLPSMRASFVEPVEDWRPMHVAQLDELIAKSRKNADAFLNLVMEPKNREFLASIEKLPEALHIFNDRPDAVANREAFEAFKDRGLKARSFAEQLFKASIHMEPSESRNLQETLEFALHSIFKAVASATAAPHSFEQKRIEAIKGTLKSILYLAKDGKFALAPLSSEEKYKYYLVVADIGGEDGSFIKALAINPQWADEYWQSPVYWQGELLRIFAFAMGTTHIEAIKLRAAYWAIAPESFDPRVVRSQALMTRVPSPTNEDWRKADLIQRGFDFFEFQSLGQRAQHVFMQGSLEEMTSFLKDNYIHRFPALKEKLAEPSLSGSNLLTAFWPSVVLMELVGTLDNLWAVFNNRFADQSSTGAYQKVEHFLSVVQRMKSEWIETLHTAGVIEKLKNSGLLADRFYSAVAEPSAVAAARGDFATYLASPERESCEGRATKVSE